MYKISITVLYINVKRYLNVARCRKYFVLSDNFSCGFNKYKNTQKRQP